MNWDLIGTLAMYAGMIALPWVISRRNWRAWPNAFDKPSRRIQVRLYEDEIAELTRLGYGDAAAGIRRKLNQLTGE